MALENLGKEQPGDPISAAAWREIVAEVKRLGKLSVSAPLQMTSDGDGITLSVVLRQPVWFEIASHLSGEGAYGVIVGQQAAGQFNPASDGASFAFHDFDYTLPEGQTYNAVFVNKAEEGKGQHWLDVGGHYWGWSCGATSDGYLLILGHTFDTQLCETEEPTP